ncbi:Serine carboxypeptidase, serine active site [Sesbania bispinosa]|nr:Serine carboxypeptidase, serine active site [Sesbania bispinosa]
MEGTCITILLYQKVNHLRTQWFYGLTADRGALASMALYMSMVSNIIYLDSPAGVGFSYSKNKSDYITGDVKTASDTHTFLLKWFELYPEFLPNPLFISGESYAGIYVPTLAQKIVEGIEAGKKPSLNFKGYMIGNAYTDDEFDGTKALFPFAHGMGLISDDLFEEFTEKCKGKYDPSTPECSKLLSKVMKVLEGLNDYDILEPCYHDDGVENQKPHSVLPFSFRQLHESFDPKKLHESDWPLPMRKIMYGHAWPLKKALVKDGRVSTWPQLSKLVPCEDDEVATSWLNNHEVRRAIYTVEESVVIRWQLCTLKIYYVSDIGSAIEYHKNLTSKGYRALIYSGDHDMIIPFPGTKAWMRSIGYKIVDEWRPWFVNDQVAGFTQGYDKNLTFLTIKGAGHAVPQYKPQESLNFYKRFLTGLPI